MNAVQNNVLQIGVKQEKFLKYVWKKCLNILCVFSNLINMIHATHLEKMIIPNNKCKTVNIVYPIINRLISMLGFDTFNGIEGAKTKFMLS